MRGCSRLFGTRVINYKDVANVTEKDWDRILANNLKAALNNLTQGLALDFRDSGVRVNAVMPGGVRTPLAEEWLHQYLGRAPVKADFDIPSLAEPEQIAKVIAVLASKDMAWVNGVTLAADGGFGL